MADNRLKILVEAALNEGLSIGNINKSLRDLQKKVNSLNIKMAIDSKVLQQLNNVKSSINDTTKKFQEQNNVIDGFTKHIEANIAATNRETKALLAARNAQKEWNLERERTNKIGMKTQTWGNNQNNDKRKVLIDANGSRIETPYQESTKNQLKDLKDIQSEANKIAQQRANEAKARQSQIESEKKAQIQATEVERQAEQKRLADRLKLEQQINDRWLKNLQEREQKENQTNQKNAQNYSVFWEKAIVERRNNEQKYLSNLQGSTLGKQTLNTNGIVDTNRIDMMNAQYQRLQQRIASLKASGQELSTSDINGINLRIQALDRLAVKQKNSEQLARQQLKAEQDIAKMTATYGNKVDSGRLTQLNNELKQLTINSQNFKARATAISQEIRMIGENARIATLQSRGFSESLGNAFRNMALYAGAGSFFFGAINAMQNMISTIIEVDSQLTQMKRVMDASTDFEQTMQTSINLANEFGRSIQDVNENMISFARMGFNADDTAELAKVTTLFQNISDLTTEEAVNGITSALINFNISAQDSLKIADSINEVDNRFAVSSQDIVTSLNKSASAARTFGFSMNQVIGATAAIGTATRESGSIIGNSLKSILSRVTTNPKAVNALADIGINQKDVNGQQKQAFTILDELAGKWNKLTSSQQQNTAVNVAGVYQLNRLLAYLNNYQIALNATQAAENSAGSAMTENQKYMESLQAKIQQLKTAWDTLSITFGNKIISDSIVLITGLLTTLTSVFNKAVDTVGALPVVLGLLWATFTVGSVTLKTFFVNTIEATRGLLGLGTTAGASSASVLGLSVATGALKNSLRALAATSGVGLVLVALGFIAEKLMNQFVDAGASIEETESKIQKLNETNSNINELKNMADEYDVLAQKTNLTGEEKNRLAIIESNLASKQGIVLSTLKNQTEAYKENAQAIKDRISLLETERTSQIRDAGLEYDQNAVANQRDLENARKDLSAISQEYKVAEKNYLSFIQARQKGESLTGRAKDFGLDQSFNDQLSFGGGIDRIGEMLAEKYKDLDEKNQKAQIAVQQGENKRAASLRNAFEINITSLGDTISKLSEADKALLDIYADIASSSSKSNAEIVNNLPQIITSIKLIDKSNIDNVTSAFERLTDSGSLTTEQLTNLQSKISAFNNQPTIEGTDEMIANFQDASTVIEDFFKKMDSYADDIGKLNQIIYDLNQGQSLNSQQVYELIKSYPELAGHIKKTADGWTIEKKAINNLRNAKIELVKTDVESQKDMAKATVNATLQRLKMYGIEIKAINNVQDAIKAKNKIETETSPMIANPPIKPNDLNFANPFNNAFMNALKQKDQQSYNDLKNSLDQDKNKATSEALGAVESYIDSNESFEKQLNDILKTVASKDYGVDLDKTKDKTDKVKKSTQDLNATYTESIKLLTETQKKLKEIDDLRDKEERRQKRLKEGSEAYINSLQRQNKERQKQIDLLKNASAQDLISQEVTITRKGSNDNSGDYLGSNLSSGLNGILNEAKSFEGNFTYSQSRVSQGKTYDQFVQGATADCSEFVQRMFDQFLDIKLPSTTQTQVKEGTKVDKKDLQPGDLVFFNTDKKNGHVGIYMGDGKFSHMGNSGAKAEEDLNSEYWSSRYSTARRISGASTSASANISPMLSASYSGKYSNFINKYGNQYGVDPRLIASIIQTESNFDPKAVSSAGAKGLTQLMPDTAKGLGVTNAFDPEQAIKGGTKLFARLLKKYGGDVELALYAYNAGEGNVDKWIKSGKISNIPFAETKKYAPKVLSTYESLGGNVNNGLNTGQATKYKYNVPSADDLQNAEDQRLKDIADAEDAIYEGNIKIIEQVIKSYENAFNKLETKIATSQTKQSNFSVDSEDYRKQSMAQSNYIQQEQDNLAKRNERIKELIKTYNITSGEFDQELAENSAKWWELQKQRSEKAQEVTDSYLTSYKNKLDDVSHSLDMSNAKLALMDEGSSDYNKEMANQIPLLEKQKELYSKQADFIDGQLNSQKLEKAYRDQLLQDRKQLSIEWWKTAEAIQEINDQLRKLQEDRADQIIEDYKSAIEEQKNLALAAIDTQKTAEDDRHKKAVENIKKESDDYKKYINDRIEAYNRANKTTDYTSDLEKAIKARDEIQRKIDVLSLDNSLSAKQKRADLTTQLNDANENITKMRTDRERELTVQSLNDQLDSHEEYTDEIQKKEDDYYEQNSKKIDDQKKKVEKSYDDMLNNEKKFYQLKQGLMSSDKNVVNSTIGEIKEYYASLFDFMNKSTFDTAQSFENLSYKIQQSLEKVTKFSTGDYSNISSPSDKTTPATDLAKQNQVANEKSAWATYVNNKKQAEDIKNKMAKLNSSSSEYKSLQQQFNNLKSSNDKLRSQYNFVDYSYDIIKRLTSPTKVASMDTGGYTGSWGKEGKLLLAHEKELMLNKTDTSNVLQIVDMARGITEKIKNASNSISNLINNTNNNTTNSQTTGDTIIKIDMTGALIKDGSDFGSKMVNILKKDFGVNISSIR